MIETRGAFFLDRDGVINKKPPEHCYVLSKNDLVIHPGVPEAIQLIKEEGYAVFVITNQRGVARGQFKWEDLQRIHEYLNNVIERESNTRIDGIYVCPHNLDECTCRKPEPGLVLQATRDHNIDLEQSWLIGDSDSDIECGRRAGVGNLRQMSTDGSLLEVVKEILINE